jgi:hypothetical protein
MHASIMSYNLTNFIECLYLESKLCYNSSEVSRVECWSRREFSYSDERWRNRTQSANGTRLNPEQSHEAYLRSDLFEENIQVTFIT